MLQPRELKCNLPMELSHGVISQTSRVWEMLLASKNGDLLRVKELTLLQRELLYAQYNYTPPVHLAVREGHTELVKYLLDNGAHAPDYKTYPFSDCLQTMAEDRGHLEIARLLQEYAEDPSRQQFSGDNGQILYNRSERETEFEKAVDDNDIIKTKQILEQHPEFAKDDSYFWSEGILLFAVKENKRPMIDLLMSYGAKVPDILKWAQFYYFEHDAGAPYILEKGMNPDTMSWHHVTLLHDMAQKGNLYKAGLLLNHGAAINAVNEEYQSTPLGMAARWGQHEMVEFLLQHGADPGEAGAAWSTPLAWARKKGYPGIEKILLEYGAR